MTLKHSVTLYEMIYDYFHDEDFLTSHRRNHTPTNSLRFSKPRVRPRSGLAFYENGLTEGAAQQADEAVQ